MATTTNFGWETPDDTDLVKDGALAMRTLGNAIDTSLVDLKGGTTGQVLSKTSNTDMDFTWVTSDDANAIQNTIVDAKGDLITATGSDVPARLAVGNNGDTLLADSSATTGLRWQGNFAAGKNKIINGDFGIWQRGTSFSNPSNSAYTADRFNITFDGSGATRTISRQAFTAGAAPVAGYESEFFFRYERSVAGSSATFDIIRQPIEDVRTFAGQTVTVSFWAKTDSGTPIITVALQQVFGSGGSTAVRTDIGTATLSTSWARYTVTATMPSISGKTIGASNYVNLQLRTPVNTIQTFDFWGVQVEAGSVATAFQTATGTLQGELAACQRYFQNLTRAHGSNFSTTAGALFAPFRVEMRNSPTVTYPATLTNAIYLYGAGNQTPSALATQLVDATGLNFVPTLTGQTAGMPISLQNVTITVSSEL
jgi:hypothetical protein